MGWKVVKVKFSITQLERNQELGFPPTPWCRGSTPMLKGLPEFFH